MIREALHNVQKHASASRVAVSHRERGEAAGDFGGRQRPRLPFQRQLQSGGAGAAAAGSGESEAPRAVAECRPGAGVEAGTRRRIEDEDSGVKLAARSSGNRRLLSCVIALCVCSWLRPLRRFHPAHAHRHGAAMLLVRLRARHARPVSAAARPAHSTRDALNPCRRQPRRHLLQLLLRLRRPHLAHGPRHFARRHRLAEAGRRFSRREPDTWEGKYIAANGAALLVGGAVLVLVRRRARGIASASAWRVRRDAQPLAQGAGPGARTRPARQLGRARRRRPVRDPHRRLFLHVLSRPGSRAPAAPGVARSTDGIHWEKLRTNPILELGEDGAFDENGLGEPAVWQSHGFYWMLYTGRDRRRASPPGPGALDATASRGRSSPASIAGHASVERESGLRPHRGGRRRRASASGSAAAMCASPDENLHGQIGVCYAGVREVNVGITCYPTYGGSGIVATELGLELATRGHEVHFITYANPIRLDPGHAAHPLSRGGSLQLPAVPVPAVLPGAGLAHGGGGGELRARSAARALRHPAFDLGHAGAADAGAARARCRSSPRCTAPISRWWAPTVPTFRSPNSPSSNRTASPPSASTCAQQTVEVFGVHERDPRDQQLRQLRSLPARRRKEGRRARTRRTARSC